MPFDVKEAYKVGEQIGIDWEKVDFVPEDLAIGMDVELEHGTQLDDRVNITDDDPELTAKIAWAHLMEAPNYYDLLAEMEKHFGEGEDEGDRKRESRAPYRRQRKGYQIQVDPSKKRWEKPQLSPEMEQYVKQYAKEIETAVKKGETPDEAFKQILPDLDELSQDDLVNLLWENKQLGGRGALQKFKDLLPALDIFDMIQKILERAIWEGAVYWWSTTHTQKQPTKEEQEAAKQRDDTETVVEKKKTNASLRYRGYKYSEWKAKK
jgi:hypothetical protein